MRSARETSSAQPAGAERARPQPNGSAEFDPLVELQQAAGEPQAKFDYDWGTMRIEKGEWVYADRGLTLFLSSDHSRIFHLAVFPRTTMQGYEENFQLDLGERRFPTR